MDMIAAIRKRFAPPAHVLLAEVGNATGFRASRRADALAVSIWPSRGLYFVGIECKRGRGDWLNELKRPEKADVIAKFCHYWWLVTETEGIARADEIPATWGWAALTDRGKWRTLKEAPLATPQPPTVAFVAAVMRRWAEGMIPKSQVQAAQIERVAEARKEERARADREVKRVAQEVDRLRKIIGDFEQHSGLSLSRSGYHEDGHSLPRIGHAVKMLLDKQHRDAEISEIRSCLARHRRQSEIMEIALREMEAVGKVEEQKEGT